MQCPLTHAMGGGARVNALTTSECTSFGNQAHASCVGTGWIGTWCTIIIVVATGDRFNVKIKS